MSITLRKTFAMAMMAALAAACQTETPEQTGTTEEIATDTETIRQGIETTNDQFEQAVLTGDGAALAVIYTTDGVVMSPNMPRAEGTEAIASFWNGMMAEGPPTAINLTTDRVIVAESGDLAVEIGTYEVSGSTPDGVAWEEAGKYSNTWQNVDGEWKLAIGAFSSDTPPPGTEGASTAGKAHEAGAAGMEIEDPAGETN